MDTLEHAKRIVGQMYDNDHFSRWLGIKILMIEPGCCQIEMTIKKDMLNGFGVAHGGITFSFADSALAFASNSRGRHAVSVETSISHIAPLTEGDIIRATAREEHLGHKISIYQIKIHKADHKIVGLFKGVVYRKSTEWKV